MKDMEGKLEESIKIFKECLEIFEKEYGKDAFYSIEVYHSLAIGYYK